MLQWTVRWINQLWTYSRRQRANNMPKVYSLVQAPRIRAQRMKSPPVASQYFSLQARIKGNFSTHFKILTHSSVQMATESPVQVEPLKTPVSAKKHRRKLFLSNEKTNDENKSQKSLNESFEGNFLVSRKKPRRWRNNSKNLDVTSQWCNTRNIT